MPQRSDSLYLHLRTRAVLSAATVFAVLGRMSPFSEPGWFRTQMAGANMLLRAGAGSRRAADKPLGARE
jgi:hypothetical protein